MELRASRILITGGAGFIGSNLAEFLIKQKLTVTMIDNMNNYYDPEIKKRNIQEVKEVARQNDAEVYFYQGDICDKDFLNYVFEIRRPEVVIHLAAYAGVRPSILDPSLYAKVNVGGTVNLLDVMERFEVKRLVFASSSSVYGNNKKVPFSESDAVDHPISPYAATKKAGELICHTYHHLYDINTACLRFFTVYGRRQRPDLAIHKFTRAIVEGKTISLYGDGSTKRDYTYIDDIIDGIYKAMQWTDSEEKRYGIFNLGESRVISLAQMVKTIEECLKKQAVINYMPAQPGDVSVTYADISLAKQVLGYQPNMPFDHGIERFVQWFMSQKER